MCVTGLFGGLNFMLVRRSNQEIQIALKKEIEKSMKNVNFYFCLSTMLFFYLINTIYNYLR